MRIIRDLRHCPTDCQGAVVALGNFDGVHLGHQAIMGQCVASARAYRVPAAVMTFEPHPREFFSRQAEEARPKRLRLSGFNRKIALLETLGIDTLFLVRFNATFAAMTAERFVDEVLHRQLGVRHVVTGYNFAFGKERGGDTDFLALRGHQLGFGTTACPPVQDANGGVISSSAIRQKLREGDVRQASALLGFAYAIEGRVRHGDQRGRQLGFPTANLSLRRLYAPRYGVYAVRVQVRGHDALYEGVANIGTRPTVEGSEALLEVHIFDHSPNLYDSVLSVTLTDFLREERRFESLDALKAQIAHDCEQARLRLKEAA